MTKDIARYGCQISLPSFGEAGQRKLQRAKVLIVGLGGLGCPAAQYLAAAGVGSLTLADHDTISQTNLHRQILFGPADVGVYKAEVAARVLRRQNPGISLTPLIEKLTAANAEAIVRVYNVVVDCTDNFTVRYALNDACVLAGVPLVYGAAYRHEGQAAVWNVRRPDGSYTANYRDAFPVPDFSNAANCVAGGVLPTLTGIVGCIQANEVLKYLTGTGELLSSQLLLFDAGSLRSRVIGLPPATAYGRDKVKLAAAADTFEVSVAQLQQLLDGKACELIDVRGPAEHQEYNIGGRLVPLEQITAGNWRLTTELPVVFYCRSGARSAAAVQTARQLFPESQFHSLTGGVLAWQQTEAAALPGGVN